MQEQKRVVNAPSTQKLTNFTAKQSEVTKENEEKWVKGFEKSFNDLKISIGFSEVTQASEKSTEPSSEMSIGRLSCNSFVNNDENEESDKWSNEDDSDEESEVDLSEVRPEFDLSRGNYRPSVVSNQQQA